MSDAECEEYNLFCNYCLMGIRGGVMLYILSQFLAIPCKALNEVGFDNSLWL